jgi:hypothetical protein
LAGRWSADTDGSNLTWQRSASTGDNADAIVHDYLEQVMVVIDEISQKGSKTVARNLCNDGDAIHIVERRRVCARGYAQTPPFFGTESARTYQYALTLDGKDC